jgi:Hydroxyacylglutathione hydrolase C-terminus
LRRFTQLARLRWLTKREHIVGDERQREPLFAAREAGKFTLPTTITIELATNPFLRADDPDIQAGLGMAGSDPVAVFTELRERKNRF